MLQRIAQNGGIPTADIDTGGLDLVEADRAVALGLQVLGGSIREALDRVAASAFLDWFHHARELAQRTCASRMQGDLVANPGSRWTRPGGARGSPRLSRGRRRIHARGVAALQVTKSAGDPLGGAYVFPHRHLGRSLSPEPLGPSPPAPAALPYPAASKSPRHP